MITETLHIRDNLTNLGGRAAHNMTFQSESRVETLDTNHYIVEQNKQNAL